MILPGQWHACSLDLPRLEIDAASSIYRGGFRCCGYMGFGLADADRTAHKWENLLFIYSLER
jgi:hypothetical protein